MDPLRQEFIEFALQAGVLKFGDFVTKAGRRTPYFFNAGLFNRGALLGRLAGFYGRTLLEGEKAGRIGFDMLFGPAYKGIVLVAAVAIELARLGRSVPFAYNRKEHKDHGEGGRLVGAPLSGRVVVVDDVISAGTSVRESAAWIRAADATPAALAIALDRQERAAQGGVDKAHSAVQYVMTEVGMKVVAIATLTDLLEYLSTAGAGTLAQHAGRVAAYRDRYGV